jgi:hypothetical protein
MIHGEHLKREEGVSIPGRRRHVPIPRGGEWVHSAKEGLAEIENVGFYALVLDSNHLEGEVRGGHGVMWAGLDVRPRRGPCRERE